MHVSEFLLKFNEMMKTADRMDPEAVAYEIEELQDRMIELAPLDVDLTRLRSVYSLLSNEKLKFRKRT